MPSVRVKRLFVRFVAVVVVLAATLSGAAGAWYYQASRGSLPQTSGVLSVAGLRNPVEVRRDARGVPHIKAQTMDDLFLAQGYVTAQDRLFQMDLVRRDAAGELAEVFGVVAVPRDRSQRRYGFRSVVEQAYASMEPDITAQLDAYARGVNAFIEQRRGSLPLEFRILGYEPRPWSPLDTLLIGKAMALTLNNSWEKDIMRADFAAMDKDIYRDLFIERSAYDVVLFGNDQTAAPAQDTRPPAAANANRAVSRVREDFSGVPTPIHDDPRAEFVAGSNNWVVAGSHTASGKPLLANDPHLPISVPPIWYVSHLTCPATGFDVAGVTFPGSPGIVIGHNGRIAWGVTNFEPDVQDLYAETFDASGTSYQVGNEWIKADTRTETILVRTSFVGFNHEREDLQVQTTRHGPIVRESGARRFALRWTALDPTSEMPAFFYLNRATNWDDFRNALRKYPGPMQNFVYADVDGNIGYTGAGNVPVRATGTGETPNDGASGEGEWQGYVPFENLPMLFNPAAGFIATANQRITGTSVPEFYAHDWFPPFRARRIVDLLDKRDGLTGADMSAIQNDIYSYPDAILARETLAIADERIAANDPAAAEWAEIRTRLTGFDGNLTTDSTAAAILVTMRARLYERVVSSALGKDYEEYHWYNRGSLEVWLIETRPGRWLPAGVETWDRVFLDAYRAAKKRLEDRFGSDASTWRYGRLNVFAFNHPLSKLPGLAWVLNLPERELDGSQSCVRAIGATNSWAPSMRIVSDLSDFDRTTLVISSGQSGQNASSHYADQVDAWSEGRTFVFPFTDTAVDAASVERLTLTPQSS